MDQRDLATIRLVTRHFRELQGLRLAVPGAVNMTVFGAWLARGGPTVDLPLSVVVLVVCLSHGFITYYLNDYYETRFGVVEEQGGLLWSARSMLAAAFVAAFVLVLTGWPLGLVFVPFAGFPAWIAVRDFPRRSYHLVGVAGSLTAASIMWIVHPAPAATAFAWAAAIHGMSLIPGGLLDHQLLARTVRDQSAQEHGIQTG